MGAFEAKEGPEWDDFERAIDLLRHDLRAIMAPQPTSPTPDTIVCQVHVFWK